MDFDKLPALGDVQTIADAVMLIAREFTSGNNGAERIIEAKCLRSHLKKLDRWKVFSQPEEIFCLETGGSFWYSLLDRNFVGDTLHRIKYGRKREDQHKALPSPTCTSTPSPAASPPSLTRTSAPSPAASPLPSPTLTPDPKRSPALLSTSDLRNVTFRGPQPQQPRQPLPMRNTPSFSATPPLWHVPSSPSKPLPTVSSLSPPSKTNSPVPNSPSMPESLSTPDSPPYSLFFSITTETDSFIDTTPIGSCSIFEQTLP
ncbi:hypothetical protein K435DRAFT_866780 [Dendrothele bispora CBS 962.96]|uniref:Uncharacterized protein n=1 Tax=Dendrothele bispora (strain CBS 962.96) TaxID=1314807 RepID=A0A4S8LGJ8_DENBC|nr:hypothetical protein K435DRAFT_866780 [Dendrothele bispora CBS 962.96]